MSVRKTVKKNAKASLSGKWGKAILILLIFIGVNVVLNILDSVIFEALGYENMHVTYKLLESPSFQFEYSSIGEAPLGAYLVSVAFSLIRLCIMAPLMLGIINWALELTDGRAKPVGTVFWAYDNTAFGRSVLLDLSIAIKTSLFSLVIMLIPMLLIGFGSGLAAVGSISPALGIIMRVSGGLLLLACVPFVLWFAARYFVARLLLCDRYYYTTREATHLSVEATRGRRWAVVGFYFSFLPWYLLCVLLLPLLYVLPYYRVSSVMYARYLFEDYLMRQKKLDLTDPGSLIVDDVAPEDYQSAREEQGVPVEPEAPAVTEAAPAAPAQAEDYYYPRPQQQVEPSPDEKKDDSIADL